MSTRRNFLQFLGCVLPIVGIGTRSNPIGDEDKFTYGGWQVGWSGWQVYNHVPHYYGTYTAGHKSHPDLMLYACYPGTKGETHIGYQLDHSVQKGQQFVCLHNNANDLKRYQLLAKKDILDVIDDFIRKHV